MIKLLIGVIVAAVAVIGGLILITPLVNQTTAGTITEVDTGHTFIIEGEVNKVGSYTLKEESPTMATLIEAAGGLTADADERAFFETAILQSGSTYYIASKFDYSDICNDSEIDKVNINEDDAETLISVNGITSSIASSIVSHRAGGEFKTLEDLLDVYGIGNATYRKIRNFVILHE